MAKDLRIDLTEDRPGAFAAVAQALGDAGINVDGVTEVEGIVHVLVEDAAGARAALEASNHKVADEVDVLVVPLADRPGELARLTRRLADARVSLRFVYLATNTRVVIGADDIAAAGQAAGG
jgi:hypothetical protein